MGGKKDLLVNPWDDIRPLVLPVSKFHEEMYLENARLRCQLKAIKGILKDC